MSPTYVERGRSEQAAIEREEEPCAPFASEWNAEKACGSGVNAYSGSQTDLSRQAAQQYRYVRGEWRQKANADDRVKVLRAYFRRIFATLPFPLSWAVEGFVRPSEECANKAADIVVERFSRYRNLPVRHSISRSVGFVIEYARVSEGRVKELFVEVDDDLDAIAVLSCGSEVVASACYDNPVERDFINAEFLG